MSAVHGINSLRPITVYHERREHACVPRRHAGRRHLPDGIHAPVQPVHKPRPVCAQSHGRKCESGSRRRFEPASAGSNVDCHDIHAIAAEPDGFRSQFTFPGVGPQHGSHAIAVEIDSRPQVVMAIRLNEALRASVGSTDAPNRVLDDSVSSDRRAQDRSKAKPDEVVQTPVARLSGRAANRATNAYVVRAAYVVLTD